MRLTLGMVSAVLSFAAFAYAREWKPRKPTAEGVSTVVELLGFASMIAAAFLFNLEIGLLAFGLLLVAAGAYVIVPTRRHKQRPARAGADR